VATPQPPLWVGRLGGPGAPRWDLMKRRIAKKLAGRIVHSVDKLEMIWMQEWDDLTIEDINNVILMQRNAVKRCWDHKGSNEFHG
jgi:hypothetical protein